MKSRNLSTSKSLSRCRDSASTFSSTVQKTIKFSHINPNLIQFYARPDFALKIDPVLKQMFTFLFLHYEIIDMWGAKRSFVTLLLVRLLGKTFRAPFIFSRVASRPVTVFLRKKANLARWCIRVGRLIAFRRTIRNVASVGFHHGYRHYVNFRIFWD